MLKHGTVLKHMTKLKKCGSYLNQTKDGVVANLLYQTEQVPDLKGDSQLHFILVKGTAKNKPYSY